MRWSGWCVILLKRPRHVTQLMSEACDMGATIVSCFISFFFCQWFRVFLTRCYVVNHGSQYYEAGHVPIVGCKMLWDLKRPNRFKAKIKTEHTGLGKLEEPVIINTSGESRSGPGFPFEGAQAGKGSPALYLFFQKFQKKNKQQNMKVKIGPKRYVYESVPTSANTYSVITCSNVRWQKATELYVLFQKGHQSYAYYKQKRYYYRSIIFLLLPPEPFVKSFPKRQKNFLPPSCHKRFIR